MAFQSEPTEPGQPVFPEQHAAEVPASPPPMPAPAGPFKTWLGAKHTFTRGVLVVGILVLMCGSCGFGALLHGSGSPQAASSGQTAQTGQATMAPTGVPTATTPAKAKAWVTTHHFNGSQNQQTPTFSIPDGSRIVWTEKLTSKDYNLLMVDLYNSDGSLADLIVNNANDKSDQTSTYNVHGGGDVYLKVTTDQVTYDIAVQVYQ